MRRAVPGAGTLAAAAALVALLGPVGEVAGQQPDTLPPDSVIRVEGVRVSVPRAATTAGGTSALEVRIDSLAVPAAPTLEQALREMPLLQVRTNSRGEAQPALRGADERQIAILLDGVPLTLGWDHRTDLSVIPLTAVQTLRVHRGLASVLHGPNVLGGVLEVGVGRGDAAIRAATPVEVSAGLDHTGARRLGAVGARTLELGPGRALLRGGVGYRARDWLPAPEGVLDPPAPEGRRLNSDLEHVDGFLSGRWRSAGGAWLSTAGSMYRARRGVPPELGMAEPRRWRYPLQWRGIGALSAGTGMRPTPWGVGDLEASLGIDRGRSRIESYESAAYARLAGEEDARDRTLTLRLLGDHSLGAGELRGAFTFADVRHDEAIRDLGSECALRSLGFCAERAAYRQRLWSAGAELAGRALGTRLSAGVALDGADTPESGDKPPLGALRAWGGRVGATRLVHPSLLVHAGASRRARFPSLRELYSGALGRFEPNPHLRPEVQVAAEAGGTWRSGRSHLQAVAFHQRLSGAIARVPTAEGRLRRENLARVRGRGLELLVATEIERVGIGADLTLQRVRTGEGQRAEYHPDIAGGVDLALVLPGGVRASGGLTYTGAQQCVAPGLAERLTLPGWSRLDAALSRAFRAAGRPFEGVALTAAADNLLDRAAYDQCGLPQPGRTLRLEVRAF